MKSLESIPRELCHQILGNVFEPAITADVNFNSALEKYVRSYYGNARLELYNQILPGYLSDALGSPPSRQEQDIHERPTQFAPNVSRMATTLTTVFPDLADDIDFVLSKSLDQFEKDSIEVMDVVLNHHKDRDDWMRSWGFTSKWKDTRDATWFWAHEAGLKGQLSEWGYGMESRIVNGSEKIGRKATLRFQRVVEKYRKARWMGWARVGDD